jgi:glycosyltransferase involved in cell wall biosynthesis
VRILFLLQDTGKLYGAERATLDLVAGLRAAGEEATVLLINEARLGPGATGFRDALRARGLPFQSVTVAGRFSRSLVGEIRRMLHDTHCDLLHTTGYKADIHGGLATGWGRRIPVVSTVHGWLFRPDLKEQFYGWLNVRALRRFSRVITLSHHYEQMLLQRGVPRERLVRIPSGLDTSAFPPGPWPEPGTPYTFGIAGRLSEEKNHALFLRAARRVLDAGVAARFLIAGDGPLSSALASRIAQLGLESIVSRAGFIPREEFLSRVHAVVLCSRVENLPYAVLEAMAWGRPVVATRVGGLPDLVEEGVTGWLVPPEDEEALADRLVQLARDPRAAGELGRAGRHRLESKFSMQRHLAAHREVYLQIVSRYP